MTYTAATFMEELEKHSSPKELELYEHYLQSGKNKDYTKDDQFMGVRMGTIFQLAKTYMAMELGEIEKLLDSPFHEGRVGAVSIMDWQARDKKTTPERRKELFDLYVKRHDRINTWDLVDRSAQFVVGGYLADKPKDPLYALARSKNPMERRTAITATALYIRSGNVEETFKVAAMLVHDKEDLVQKAVGGWVREAGKKEMPRLLEFLDNYAATMPRVALRYAVEHLPAEQRAHYMGLAKS